MPAPTAGEGEVLVDVHAVGVGGGETMFRSGALRRVLPYRFPQGVGNDFAGRVASGGADGLRAGDAVYGLMPYRTFGSLADRIAVPAGKLAAAPRDVDLIHAAALPSSGTTAVTALVDKAALRAGERLLVRGAAGGVGSIVVQLGKALGAHVTALVSARNLAWIRELGADAAFDYRAIAPGDLGKFDVVVDIVGTDLGAYRSLLTRRGRMVLLAMDPNRIIASAAYTVWASATAPKRVKSFSNNPSAEIIATLTSFVDSGAIRPVVDSVFRMEQTAEAHARLEAGGVRGKYVIALKDPKGTTSEA
ncbi:NAD(P)-dependent alcohol dehydrogenase [Dactylosporangium sp. CA-092794]|uniref:NAD(P)-dependent alcohol dehydrogenase n=1 Tax=Dactylosporangium sp. CA-092794 TaxID=3239929 RepID=UPI003D92D466